MRVSVAQVHDKVFKGEYQKQGVQIKLQGQDKSADIFISSKLRPRISAELEARKEAEHPPEKATLEVVRETIQKEHTAALKRRGEIRTEIASKKADRAHTIKTAQEKIDALTAKKEAAIERVKQNLETSFASKINDYLNLRVPMRGLLYSDIVEYSKGISVGGRKHDTLAKAITHLRDQHLAAMLTKGAVYTPQQLQEKLDLIVKTLVPLVHTQYKNTSYYHETSGTFVDSFAKLLAGVPAGNLLLLQLDKPNIKMWGAPFYDLWREHFIGFMNNKEEEAQLWSCFESAVTDCLVRPAGGGKRPKPAVFNGALLEGKILNRVKEVITDPDDLFLFTSRLSYTLNTGGPAKHRAVIEQEVENTIRYQLSASMKTLAESHEALSVESVKYLGSKKQWNFNLPERLKKYTDASPATLKVAIQEFLVQQNVAVTPTQLEQITKETLEHMALYSAVSKQIVENYVPVANRSDQLKTKDGEEPLYIPDDVLESLTATDVEVLAINKELEDTIAQRNERVATLDADLVKLGEERQQNKATLQELKIELSAIKKLFTALKNLLGIFADAKVEHATKGAAEFLEEHFDLEKVVSHIDDTLLPETLSESHDGIATTVKEQVINPLLSATLQFTPPEYYKVTEDIDAQRQHVHGHIGAEIGVGSSLTEANTKVRTAAETIQERKPQIALEGVLQVDLELALELDSEPPSITVSPISSERNAEWRSRSHSPVSELTPHSLSRTTAHAPEDLTTSRSKQQSAKQAIENMRGKDESPDSSLSIGAK